MAKVYISADMEGVAGVVTSEQLGPAGFEYERFREFMTAEVSAVIEGAKAADGREFVVSDSHGNGQNLLLERLPPETRVVRSFPRPLLMMEGIDESFDAAIFLGYHSAAVNPEGVRAHTMSSARLASIELNDQAVSEATFNAALAGHFGVPVVMVSGDDVTVDETRQVLGDVEGAVTKRALGYHSAETLTPEAALPLIREAAERGVSRAAEMEPYTIEGPVRCTLAFKHYRPAELLAYLPGIERTGARQVRFVGDDMTQVARFVAFSLFYRADLEP